MNLKLLTGVILVLGCAGFLLMTDGGGADSSDGAVVASGTCGTDLNWEYDDTTKTLTISGSGTTTAQSTPTGWGGNRTSITTVNMDTPNLTSIGNSTFSGCSNLTQINLPDTLTNIGRNAFQTCTSLALTELPDSITTIGPSSFLSCSQLALVKFPDSLTSFGSNAFGSCSRITCKEIPAGVTSIGGQCFTGCSGLAISELNVETIGDRAFRNNTSIKQLVLGENVSSLGLEVFDGCTNLSQVVIKEGFNPTFAHYSSGDGLAFDGCTNLKEILNLSDLDIVAGADTYGKIAYYADIVSDHVDSTAMVQQKEFIDRYTEYRDDATSVVLRTLPVLIVVGIMLATLGMLRLRRDEL